MFCVIIPFFFLFRNFNISKGVQVNKKQGGKNKNFVGGKKESTQKKKGKDIRLKMIK